MHLNFLNLLMLRRQEIIDLWRIYFNLRHEGLERPRCHLVWRYRCHISVHIMIRIIQCLVELTIDRILLLINLKQICVPRRVPPGIDLWRSVNFRMGFLRWFRVQLSVIDPQRIDVQL